MRISHISAKEYQLLRPTLRFQYLWSDVQIDSQTTGATRDRISLLLYYSKPDHNSLNEILVNKSTFLRT